MHQVLLYLLRSSKPLVPEEEIADMLQWEELEWQKYAEECKGMIVTNPGMVRSLDVDPMAAVSMLPVTLSSPGIRPRHLSGHGLLFPEGCH